MVNGARLLAVGIEPVFDQPFRVQGRQTFLLAVAKTFFASWTIVGLCLCVDFSHSGCGYCSEVPIGTEESRGGGSGRRYLREHGLSLTGGINWHGVLVFDQTPSEC